MPAMRPVGHEETLSLIEHLDELRTRLIWSIVAFVVAFSFCYWQNHRLLNFVNQPFYDSQHASSTARSDDPLEQAAVRDDAQTKVYRTLAPVLAGQQQVLRQLAARPGTSAADRTVIRAQNRRLAAARQAVIAAAALPAPDNKRRPVTLGVTEPFVTTFTVAGYAALLISMPFLLWQAYAFVLPAFSPQERRVVLPLLIGVPFLFLSGVAFGYFVALPRAVNFLLNFNGGSFDILVQAREYYRFAVILLLVIGLLFQIPVGVLAITRLGVVSAATLAKNRGYVILAIAVVAAVATPTPDPVTMLVAMAPLVLLWEVSLIVARVVERRTAAREAAEAEAEAAAAGGDETGDEGWEAVEDHPTVS
jgi:sec-independent protein translocase protein TatC